jgi:16S rRNA processing protein RimM
VPEKGPKTLMVPMIPAAVLEWDEQRLVIAGAFAED